MKFLSLAIPGAVSLALYFILYRPAINSDSTMSQVETIGMLHVHIVFWWSAFLYLLFCLIASFFSISRVKVLLISGLGITLVTILLGFISGFIFAKPMWGIYFVWDTRFSLALLILFLTVCFFVLSFVADKVKFLDTVLRMGFVILFLLFLTSHFIGYYIPAMHPNSVIINLLSNQ